MRTDGRVLIERIGYIDDHVAMFQGCGPVAHVVIMIAIASAAAQRIGNHFTAIIIRVGMNKIRSRSIEIILLRRRAS